MTVPANVRVNIGAPFPSLVKGSGPVTISKQNGIWTVGFSVTNIGGMPVGVNPATIDILVWNTITNSFQLATLSQVVTFQNAPTKISSVNSPYTPLPTDTYLYVDTAGGPVTINLATSASRNGVPMRIKDATGHAAANNITIKPVGGGAPETVDGFTNAAPLVLKANYDGVSLSPNTLSYVIDP